MSKFNFDRVMRNMDKVKAELPPIVANDAQRFFVDSFNKQGFNEGEQPWKEVKRRTEGTPEYKYPKNKGLGRRTKAILSGTGRLKRAVNSSIKEASFDRIRLAVSDVPYAEIHNSGGTAGKGAQIPKRQYMGDSPLLREKLRKKIKTVVDKIWQV